MNEAAERAGVPGPSANRQFGLGALALSFYLVHAGRHVANGNPEEAFWACHLGALLVALGLLGGRPLLRLPLPSRRTQRREGNR